MKHFFVTLQEHQTNLIFANNSDRGEWVSLRIYFYLHFKVFKENSNI